MDFPESNKSSQLNNWANILLLISFIGFMVFGYLIYQRYNPQKLSFDLSNVQASENKTTSKTQPVGIKIDSIDLALPIFPAEIKNNKWQATTEGISYLQTSPIPGETGNSILYGHNWPNLLGNLNKLKIGDKITVIYSDNSYRNFEIEYKTQVSPTETSILENSQDYRITLYTCTGFLDSQRLVVVAKLLTNNE